MGTQEKAPSKINRIKQYYDQITFQNIKETIRLYNPINRYIAWINLKNKEPLVIVELCRSNDPVIKYLGIRTLANISDNWDDSCFTMVRQTLDYKTQIILARFSKHVDTKLFTYPPSIPLEVISKSTSKNIKYLLKDSAPNMSDFFGGILRDYSYFQGETNFLYHDPKLFDKKVQEGIDDAIKLQLKQLTALKIDTSISQGRCVKFIKKSGLQIMQQLLHQLSEENEAYLKLANLKQLHDSKTWFNYKYVERLRLQRIYDTFIRILPQMFKPANNADGSTDVLVNNLKDIQTFKMSQTASEENIQTAGSSKFIGDFQKPALALQSNLSNAQALFQIADILGNVCQYPQFAFDVVRSGWLRILVEWSRSESISLSVRALRALANLDTFRTGIMYPTGVYLCHPLYDARLDLPLINAINPTPLKTHIPPVTNHFWHFADVFPKYRERNLLTGFLDLFKFPNTLNDEAAQVPNNIKKFSRQEVDVYFIHGLMGDPFRTWRSADRPQEIIDVEKLKYAKQPRSDVKQICWPKDWLPHDIPGLRIMLLSYDTYLSEWAPKFPIEIGKRSIEERAVDLLYKITITRQNHLISPNNHIADAANTTNQPSGASLQQVRKPIIFVAHSMGGLLIKQMLLQAAQSSNNQVWKDILSDTLGVVFYSTPHRGSPVAEYTSRAFPIFFPSQEVKQLRLNDASLLKMNESFVNLALSNDIKCLNFGETRNINLNAYIKFMIVPPESSNMGYGEFYEIPTNHLYVCKPHTPNSSQYRILVHFMRDLIEGYRESLFERNNPQLVRDTLSAQLIEYVNRFQLLKPFSEKYFTDQKLKQFLRYNERTNDTFHNFTHYFPLF